MKRQVRKALGLIIGASCGLSAIPAIPVAAASGVSIDNTTFPDYYFRSYVSSHFDTDHNDFLSAAEIKAAEYVYVENEYISDLKGIEYLTSLRSLSCDSNYLSSLDLSHNYELRDLSCANNELTELMLYGCPNLDHLSCWGNNIETLDISGTELLDYYGENPSDEYDSDTGISYQRYTGIYFEYDCTHYKYFDHDHSTNVISDSVGWKYEGGKWYYLNADHRTASEWKKISNKWYYFNNERTIQTGWLKLDGDWYFFETSGILQTGWKKINSKYYYFKANGIMASSEWINGYWLDANGCWTYKPKGSWKQSGSKWWFGDTSGWYAKNTWQKIDGHWYHFDSSGYMQTGWKLIGKTWYLFNSKGILQTGWVQGSGKWYYYDENGSLKKGWLQLGNNWYYMDKNDGSMKTGWIKTGKEWDFFNSSGKWISEKRGLHDFNVGSTVKFGTYYSESYWDEDKIEWIVLAKENGKALLISKYVIERRMYDADYNDTWDKCSLRTWLNKDFYEEAFDSVERGMIQKTTVKAEENPWFGSDPGSDTKDNVFLLSINEAVKYFKNDNARKAYPTMYTDYYSYINNKTCEWWLRTPGMRGVSYVEESGFIWEDGMTFGGGVDGAVGQLSDEYLGIRPAIWIKY